jgi:homoserine dehydrogenase
VFLAGALEAERCRLMKDVDGVYDSDPAKANGGRPARFATLNYENALAIAGPLIQKKAVNHLRARRQRAEVAALGLPYETAIHRGWTTADEHRSAPPLDILLLGLGTVGFGVYQHLRRHPEHFRVIGALVRDPSKHERAGAPRTLLFTNDVEVRQLRPHLVIEALPGLEPAASLVQYFLEQGAEVVSANKAMVAQRGIALTDKPLRGALHYSAAVGGSVPMIEAVQRVARTSPIASIAAVLNGTCNFVLDQCGEGASLAQAVTEAQERGFAEADPSDDLSGRDASRKLEILARHAFDQVLLGICAQPLTESVRKQAREARASGMRLRQIARATRRGKPVVANIRLETVPADSVFGSLKGEWNALEVTTLEGPTTSIAGRGAGRWPTSESVMADVWDVRRRRMTGLSR